MQIAKTDYFEHESNVSLHKKGILTSVWCMVNHTQARKVIKAHRVSFPGLSWSHSQAQRGLIPRLMPTCDTFESANAEHIESHPHALKKKTSARMH